ncbi:hypothetical protein Acr_06g0000980 [Actinidia rufa]|uniref:Uncharacterized protein n=1 Tax=Actinidia rufa TaxID=165716 RepID=A0A7J0ENW5_9ERIC|nr:hypothetical protein Acr_06g0000980 [Actinidia rufa]
MLNLVGQSSELTGSSANSALGGLSSLPKLSLDPGMEIGRENHAVQVTSYLLMRLGIAVDRFVSIELRCSDLAELAIEQQPGNDDCPNSARTGT